MKYSSLLWGVVMYALMYLLWSTFLTYGFTAGYAPRFVTLAFLVALALFGARSLGFKSWHDILPYSFAWMLSIALLDIICVVPFTGWQLFYDWNLWVGYGLIVCVPLLAPLIRKERGSVYGHDA